MVTKQEQQRRVRDYRARQAVHERAKRRRVRDSLVGAGAALVVLLGGTALLWDRQGPDAGADPAATPAPSASETQAESLVPDPSLAEGRTWTGTLTINGVDLGVELDGEAAPQAVSGIVYDVERDYYDGSTCHRLTTSEGFSVLQCGSLDGQGGGDPSFMYGPIENAPADDLYVEGTIAMARQGGNAESNGHQFFIVYDDTTIPSDAAGGYTVVGRVTANLEQLRDDVISAGTEGGVPDGAPAEPVTIEGFDLQ